MNFIETTESLQQIYLKNLTDDIWLNSKFEWIKNLSTCKKGKIGEDILINFFTTKNIIVKKRTSIEHDLIINDFKSEIKLSCLNKSGYFKWLQIRLNDDFEKIYFISIYPNDVKVYLLSKENLLKLKNDNIIKNQQGGKRNNYDIKYLEINIKNIPDWFKKYEI